MPDPHAAQAVQKLVEIASHDLRNPLSVIMVNAAVLSRAEPLDDSRRIKAAGRILSNVGRMNRMIGDLLDFAYGKIGAGLVTRPVELDLGELAAKAVDEARTATPSRVLAMERSGDLRGQWDADRISRALQTMVSSVLKFGNPQELVRVWCRPSEDGGAVELGVETPANPATVAQVERLFESIESGAELEKDGFAIAVAVLRQTVDAHRGSLRLSASAADGIRARVNLPRSAAGPELKTGP